MRNQWGPGRGRGRVRVRGRIDQLEMKREAENCQLEQPEVGPLEMLEGALVPLR